MIFLSDVKLPPKIDLGTQKRVVLRGRPGADDDAGLIDALLRAGTLPRVLPGGSAYIPTRAPRLLRPGIALPVRRNGSLVS